MYAQFKDVEKNIDFIICADVRKPNIREIVLILSPYRLLPVLLN